MKRITTLIAVLLLGGITAYGSSIMPMDNFWRYDYNRSYIFVEGGVEFAVYPDGQFDFAYVGGNRGRVNVDYYNAGLNISFNSGYNYDLYVQYDDYGAVIQVENIPIFYDYYGRITRAGNVDIRYNNRRIVQVGGMNIYYDRWGYFSYFSGYVSPWYRHYVYRPWHVYYARPFYNNCIVYDNPYRRYYNPYRYDYAYHKRNYNNRGRRSYANGRRSFERPGSRIHYKDGRVARNKDYRAGRENTMVDSRTRPARDYGKDDATASSRPVTRELKDRTDRTKRSNGNMRPAVDNRVESRDRTDRTRAVASSGNNRSDRMKPAANSSGNRSGMRSTNANTSRSNNKAGRNDRAVSSRSQSRSNARTTQNRSRNNSASSVNKRSGKNPSSKPKASTRSSRSSQGSANRTRSARGNKL